MELAELIRFEAEGTTLDFKREQYKKHKNKGWHAFIKDVIAFANADVENTCYIIIGVDGSNGGKDICGINEVFLDASTYQEIVHEYIEPDLTIAYDLLELDGKKLGIFKIKGNDGPYLVKKQYNPSHKDFCLKIGDL